MKTKALSLSMIAVLLVGQVACTVDQVLTDVNLLIQTAGSIGTAIGAVSPAEAAIIAGLSTLASKGLSAIQATYDTYKKSQATTDLEYQMSRRQAQLEKSTRLGCEREWLTAVVAKVYTDRPKWLE